jgi:hypothetical protein
MKKRSRVKHVAAVGTVLLLVAACTLVYARPALGQTSAGSVSRLAVPLTLAWQWVLQRVVLLTVGGMPEPDATPSFAPPNLMLTAPGPTIQDTQSYINPTFLTAHTTAQFDSSGGDLILVCASSHAGVTMTPSDSFNNTWVSAAGPTNTSTGFDLRTQVWYAKNPTVGPRHTFTLNLSALQPLVISLFVVKGSNASAPIDAISLIGDDGGSKTRKVASQNITTTRANDLLIGFAKSSMPEDFTPGSGYTAQPAASSNFLDAESRVTGAAGTYNSTFTLNSRAASQTVIVAVAPSASVTASSASEIELSWTAFKGNVGVTGYQVERCQGAGCSDFRQIAIHAGTSFKDTGLTGSTLYSYRVRANDATGNLISYSNTASANTQADTTTPTASSLSSLLPLRK